MDRKKNDTAAKKRYCRGYLSEAQQRNCKEPLQAEVFHGPCTSSPGMRRSSPKSFSACLKWLVALLTLSMAKENMPQGLCKGISGSTKITKSVSFSRSIRRTLLMSSSTLCHVLAHRTAHGAHHSQVSLGLQEQNRTVAKT